MERRITGFALLDKRREIAGRIDQAVTRLRLLRSECHSRACKTLPGLRARDGWRGCTTDPRDVQRSPQGHDHAGDHASCGRRRGQDVTDPKTFGAMRRRVSQALRRMQAREEAAGELVGQSMVWTNT